MNRDDRAALIEMGRQFAPSLFAELDESSDDDVMLAAVGKGFAQLQAAAESAQAERAQAKADLEALRAAARSNGESSGHPGSQNAPSTGCAQHPVADDQPSYAEVGLWLEKQNLSVTRREMHFQEQPGGRRRRVYRAVDHPATVDDVLGSKLDAGEMHLVMSDGKTHCLPWK